MQDLSLQSVFDAKYQVDNSYVDWVGETDYLSVVEFVVALADSWPASLLGMPSDRLRGGLKVLCMSGGLQARVFGRESPVAQRARQQVISASSEIFFGIVAMRPELQDLAFIWWDDLALQLSPDVEGGVLPPNDETSDSLFRVLIAAASCSSVSAQEGAFAALGVLSHSRTKAFARAFLLQREPLCDSVRAAAESLLGSTQAE